MPEFIIVSLLVGSFMLMTIGHAYMKNSKKPVSRYVRYPNFKASKQSVSRHVRSSQRGGINKRKWFGGE